MGYDYHMKIGILGAGNIGVTVGNLWLAAGHEILLSSRHPESLVQLVNSLGARAGSGTIEEAAAFGQIIFTAFPYGSWPDIALKIEALTTGKILIDAANPNPERDGDFATQALHGEGAGLPVAQLLHGTHVVRALNTVNHETLRTEAHRKDPKVGIPIAGDDAAALEMAAMLVKDAGFEPLSIGGLRRAKLFDPGTPVYNTGMTAAEIAQELGLQYS